MTSFYILIQEFLQDWIETSLLKMKELSGPTDSVDKNPPANAGITGSIPDSGDPTCGPATKPEGKACAPQQEKLLQWEAQAASSPN